MRTKKHLLYYAIWTLCLLGVEILIGSCLNDWKWIRSYGGDILVIPLLYCMIRMFTQKLPRLLPVLVFGIGVLAELTQYLHLSDRLGFARGSLPAILLGTSASWWDVLCYAAGAILIGITIFLRVRLTKRNKI